MRVASSPGWDDSGEAARLATSCNNEHLIRSMEIPIERGGIFGGDCAIGQAVEALEFGEGTGSSLVDSLADLPLCPAFFLKDRHMFRTEHQHPASSTIERTHHSVDNGANNTLTRATYLAIDIVRCLACKNGDGTDILRHAAFGTQRFPGITLLVLSNTIAIFARMPQAG